jgi:hypothetical protein
MPRIDTTINIGNILTATMMLVGGLTVFADGRSNSRMVEQRLVVQEEALKAMSGRLLSSEQTGIATAATLAAVVEVQRLLVDHMQRNPK